MSSAGAWSVPLRVRNVKKYNSEGRTSADEWRDILALIPRTHAGAGAGAEVCDAAIDWPSVYTNASQYGSVAPHGATFEYEAPTRTWQSMYMRENGLQLFEQNYERWHRESTFYQGVVEQLLARA
jgi:hypothetical protein